MDATKNKACATFTVITHPYSGMNTHNKTMTVRSIHSHTVISNESNLTFK